MDPTPSRAARTAYVVLTVIFWITVVVGLVLVAYRLVPKDRIPARSPFRRVSPSTMCDSLTGSRSRGLCRSTSTLPTRASRNV